MSRIQSISPDKADPKVKDIYSAIQKKMGKIPNIFLHMGNSPAVLKGYLAFSEALSSTSLNPKLREQIALAVSEANNCHYCLSAHTAIAQNLGLIDQEIILSRKGEAKDSKTQAILSFAKTVISKKGHVSDQDVANLKAAGISDAELTEILLAIAMNMFTNYFNHVVDPKVDFPEAAKL